MDKVASINIGEIAADYDDKRRMDPAELKRLLGWILHYGKATGRRLAAAPGFYLVPLAQRLPEDLWPRRDRLPGSTNIALLPQT